MEEKKHKATGYRLVIDFQISNFAQYSVQNSKFLMWPESPVLTSHG